MKGVQGSVGVVKTNLLNIGKLSLDSGKTIPNVEIAYEIYGRLNEDKSNAILICHALSGDAHAAGKHRSNSRKHGWYDIAIGKNKTYDTKKYFIICSNVIGGCQGSTGPASINPKTKKPYGLSFPKITVGDMVRAQKKLIEHFNIKKLFCVSGGSMGGMQALKWATDYPEAVGSVIALATSAKQYPMGIAFHDLGRKAIINDPDYKSGNYYGGRLPKNGLSLARQAAHITYLSQQSFERKFGRKKKNKNGHKFGIGFEVQSYLKYKGESFVRRFDANSYLYITDAIDNFDLTEDGKKDLAEVFENIKSKILLISFTTDWLYPPKQVEEIYQSLAEAGKQVLYRELDLPWGHDSFLVYNNTLGNLTGEFLKKEYIRQKI